MTMRAKVRLEAVIPTTWGPHQATFTCTYDPSIEEDRRFQKATPSGEMRLLIDNPAALAQLVMGESYYVDFSMVPKEPKP